MKPLLAFLFIALPCLAQHVTPAGVGGFGNILHPGTGGPSSSFYGSSTNFYGRSSPRRNSGYITGYPLYVGGSYVPAYSSGYAPDYSAQTQLNPQQQYAPAPPVVINQYFGPPAPQEPVTTVYQPGAYRQQQQADDDSSAPEQNKYYLLAFKDHSVYSALAYWIEDKTLHYVTPQNTHNQASLDLVDVDFTKKLNQDRTVPFSTDPPSK